MTRKIPDALVARAAELIRAGSMLQDAAAAIGCNPDELSKKLRATGMRVDNRINWEGMADQVIPLYQSGLGTTAIVAKFGFPRHAAGSLRNFLVRKEVMRCRSASLSERMRLAGPEGRKTNITKARRTRARNLALMAEQKRSDRSLGFGETEIFTILSDAGIIAQQQVVVDDNYLIDIVVGSIAIEVKNNATSAHIATYNRTRCKKLVESGYSIIFVVVNDLTILSRHADDLVSIVKFAERNPPARGEYWVIRCTLEQIGSDLDVDHWSVEKRTPKFERARF